MSDLKFAVLPFAKGGLAGCFQHSWDRETRLAIKFLSQKHAAH